MVDEMVEAARTRFRIDDRRIYVTGLSLGGNGSWMYAIDFPEKVAAIVPIAGWGEPSRACAMKAVSTWAFHGDADDIVPVSGSQQMVDALLACPADPAPKLTIYPDVGHDSWTQAYETEALFTWLAAQAK